MDVKHLVFDIQIVLHAFIIIYSILKFVTCSHIKKYANL